MTRDTHGDVQILLQTLESSPQDFETKCKSEATLQDNCQWLSVRMLLVHHPVFLTHAGPTAKIRFPNKK